MKCYLCPNDCGIERSEKLGLCLCGQDMVINRIAPHYYEEPPISGTRGSGTVFFGGCVMRCDFCQNAIISRIGIVLCSETSKDIARYSVLNGNEQLFAAKYMPLMPTEEELRREIEQQKELYKLQHKE